MKDEKTIKVQLVHTINIASGREPADLVIKNARIVNVFSGTIQEGDIAIAGGQIAGIGDYEGKEEIDAAGRYAAPGFIDSHIHVESSYVSPEELGRMIVPHGGTTIMADPHEIVNVCGIKGLEYMINAAKNTVLDIRYELPSCVPATPFEHAGCVIDAEAMRGVIDREDVAGEGEFMNYPGIINALDSDIDKVVVGKMSGKFIDGHAPSVYGKDLNAYAAAGICGDHECSTVEEMQERIDRGMYVLLREGSACHNLRPLLKGLTNENSRRCLLCSDDRQPKTMLHLGHLDNHLKICVEEGVDPVTAIRMATLNAAECFGLKDRGGIAPGYRADIVLLDDLTEFKVNRVFIEGELVAEDGVYLPPVEKYPIDSVRGSVKLKDFSAEKFKMHLKTNKVNTIKLAPGGVVTLKSTAEIPLDEEGEYVFDPSLNVAKLAVIERHNLRGTVANAFLEGYGIKKGAVAVTIAHDSHNIICVGVSDAEMEAAVNAVAAQEGGMVLVKDGEVIGQMAMPIAGLMSDQDGEYVEKKLIELHDTAQQVLGVSEEFEPIMTLTFASLGVIPEVKLLDTGLFDVTKFDFMPVEAE